MEYFTCVNMNKLGKTLLSVTNPLMHIHYAWPGLSSLIGWGRTEGSCDWDERAQTEGRNQQQLGTQILRYVTVSRHTQPPLLSGTYLPSPSSSSKFFSSAYYWLAA